ncbi:hypothetical protein IJH02_02490 [Candidatus Saccharibacteria bacterium]|nr:hypothetical protein [Candidatus Saccharibacteria bacterium]
MNVAEWILVCILSVTLFVFLIVGIIFLIKLMGLIKEAKKVTITAQSIADKANSIAGKADDVATNVKQITYAGSLSSLANLIKNRYNMSKENKKGKE